MNKPKFAGVLFDLDGTLLDTAPDFAYAINQIRQADRLPQLSIEAIRPHISYGSRGLITHSFDMPPEHPGFELRRQALLENYAQNIARHTQLFPGLEQLLAQLENKGVPWGIVTNKPLEYAQPLLTQLKLLERCACLVCPDHVTHTKPHPESLWLACKHINQEANTCVYIGDHSRDIIAGKQAGMATIAAAYGYLTKEDDPASWQADWVVTQSTDVTHRLFTQHD